jgi:hypothetical protein
MYQDGPFQRNLGLVEIMSIGLISIMQKSREAPTLCYLFKNFTSLNYLENQVYVQQLLLACSF